MYIHWLQKVLLAHDYYEIESFKKSPYERAFERLPNSWLKNQQ